MKHEFNLNHSECISKNWYMGIKYYKVNVENLVSTLLNKYTIIVDKYDHKQENKTVHAYVAITQKNKMYVKIITVLTTDVKEKNINFFPQINTRKKFVEVFF